MFTILLLQIGHIGITVDDTYKACERFEHLGVEFVKKPDDGESFLHKKLEFLLLCLLMLQVYMHNFGYICSLNCDGSK